jgi:hypothetical protein
MHGSDHCKHNADPQAEAVGKRTAEKQKYDLKNHTVQNDP